MRILYFSQYFPPEIGAAPQRAYYHAKKWVEWGHGVTVVTNIPNSPFGKIYKGYKNQIFKKEIKDGINILRVLTLTSGKSSSIFIRLLSSILYMIISLRALFTKRPDIILGSAPYFAGISAFLCAKLRSVPIVYELRDPWLQVIRNSLNRLKITLRFLIAIERHVLKRANKVVVIGKNMADYIKQEYQLNENPTVVFNGIIKENFENISDDIPKDFHESMVNKFNVGLIGNMGNQYDFEMIIKSALQLKGRNIQFVFVGEGSQKTHLLKRIDGLSLKNIVVFDAIPYYQSINVMKKCDLSVIPLKSGKMYSLYLPLKLFESLALEVPVLLCNGGEAETILTQSHGGILYEDHKELSNNILFCMNNSDKCRFMGRSGKKYVMDNFERSRMAEKYINLFQELHRKRNTT